MTNEVQRCSRCIMPAHVPGVSLDAEGVCNFCRDYEQIEYRGKEEFEKIIEGVRGKGAEYDCIVPMSGGRDSTYGLYLARKVYGLKTLVVNYDNEFRHAQAMENIRKACEITETDYISVRSENDISVKLTRSLIQEEISMGFVKQPNICRACSYGIKSAPYREAERRGIPLILYAGSQEEKVQQMINTVTRAVPVPMRRKILGKLLRINPRHWQVRYNVFNMKREFPVPGNSSFSNSVRPELTNPGIKELHIFDYLIWDRKIITETIMNELGWRKTPGHKSSWRNDCKLHQYINYDFFKRYGTSRDSFGYCRMIMSGKMSREDALAQELDLLESYRKGVINGVDIRSFLLDEVGLSERETNKLM